MMPRGLSINDVQVGGGVTQLDKRRREVVILHVQVEVSIFKVIRIFIFIPKTAKVVIFKQKINILLKLYFFKFFYEYRVRITTIGCSG